MTAARRIFSPALLARRRGRLVAGVGPGSVLRVSSAASRRRSWCRLVALAGGGLAACSGAGAGAAAPDGSPAWSPTVSCSGELAVVAVRTWPGGGIQLVLEGVGAGAATLADAGGSTWLSASAEVGAAAPGDLLIVVEPTDLAARVAQARGLIAAMATDELVAVAVGGAGPRLVADLTTDRSHLDVRLAALATSAAVDQGRADPAALADALATVSGAAGPVGRDVVVLGEGEAPTPAPGFRPVRVARLALGVDPDGFAAELRAARAGRVRVGACPAPPRSAEIADGALTITTSAGSCTVGVPPPLVEELAIACDAAAAAGDDHPYPQDLAITMTAEQRAAWDVADAAGREDELALSIDLGGGVVPARAHFRGQTSLECARKSVSVDLDGPAARRLAPGMASDEFLLISLCKDDGYFRQAFGERLLAAAGLFALDRRFVRLTVDGERRGVYWLVEKPVATLAGDALASRAVVRRRFDPDGVSPVVHRPTDAAAQVDALERYGELDAIALAAPPEEVVPALAAAMDLDGYLRWLALASLLENGDYVDEIFFHAVEEGDAWWFRVLAWDPDDLATPCHHGGTWAIDDACGLTYCAEANLDHGILRAPALYARYRAVLAETLAAWPAERLATEMDAVAADLFAALADDATAAAMVELVAVDPAAVDVEVAQAGIRARMDALLAGLEDRRTTLATRLDACPAPVGRADR